MLARMSDAGAMLAEGRYEAGWPLLEGRGEIYPDLVPPLPVRYPEWRGEPLDGKSIMVWVEQGLGDQIMFARFGRLLKERGARHVTLCCRPPLVSILRTVRGVDTVLGTPARQSVVLPRHDYWTRYFSLPLHLGITLSNLPNRPYLSADPGRLAQWRPAARIGLAWMTSATGANAAHKRLPDACAQRLLDHGAVSLHPEHTGAADFADTAAVIDQLDIVVSVDTAVAHLAGAMGKPVFVMLPAQGVDWRWMRGREDSPWYPSARLFRNEADWQAVTSRVLDALP